MQRAGPLPMPPKAGSRAAGKQRATSASLRDSGAFRLTPLGALCDVAQDNFSKLHNQLLETRNLFLAAPQFALVICHLRCIRVAAIAVFHDGCRTIGLASPSEQQGTISPHDASVGDPATSTLVPQTVLRQIRHVTNEQSSVSPECVISAERFIQKAS